MNFFSDSSALAERYIEEAGSSRMCLRPCFPCNSRFLSAEQFPSLCFFRKMKLMLKNGDGGHHRRFGAQHPRSQAENSVSGFHGPLYFDGVPAAFGTHTKNGLFGESALIRAPRPVGFFMQNVFGA